MVTFKVKRQIYKMDCGPACLQMVALYYGKNVDLTTLRENTRISRDGANLLGIAEAAEKLGFHTKGVQVSFQQLIADATLPAILHWKQNHFVVIVPKSTSHKVIIADPAKGLISYGKDEFCSYWESSKNEKEERTGVALLLEPTGQFYEQQEESTGRKEKLGWGSLFQYLRSYKRYFVQIVLALFLGSLLQLVFPFLTQSVVDTGINTQDISYITIILVAQLMLIFGRNMIEFIRSRLLLHISTRINISILSDFWMKLMRLPISYFDTKQTGDTLQRIADHKRIESFLTGTSLSTVFSIFNLLILSVVLFSYNVMVFLVFAGGTMLYFFWIRFFLYYRRKLDFQRFDIASRENSITMQLIQGMQEIKLNNSGQIRRWEWENIQARLLKLSFKSLTISQYQQAGAVFINEGKNIFITFLVAKLVISGQLTLGAMLAIQYIIGQLNNPVEQLIGFMQAAQDARISLERLNEIHQIEEEEPSHKQFSTVLPENKSISISRLNYTYPGAGNKPVLKNVDLVIPEGKVTAIVGVSGSGKTTLLKLLLRFYEDYSGEINVGSSSLRSISPGYWRHECGSVMQDGFIFSDTIARNIAVSDASPDYNKLIYACQVANILPFIERLPLGFNTKIGAEGNGISTGQKQRLLIARAVYKSPRYIFFDEATNSLDANNEKEILENLQEFFKNKTVVVIAHRLSTVKHADTIVVLHEGQIVEAGNHEALASQRGHYYELVKNQLELGN
jgi:ATP-binding cassette, subfamily B, bacterial